MSKRELAIAIMQEQGLMSLHMAGLYMLSEYENIAKRLAEADTLLGNLLADMIWEG